MTPAPVVFVDRDGTLVDEPPDGLVDALEKVRFLPGVFAALGALVRDGYRLVMVTNQDGLGGPRYPRARFEAVQDFILGTFADQGVRFEAVFVCPHGPDEGCGCRKPRTGLVTGYLAGRAVDPARSAVVGDRATDLAFAANLGVRGFRVRRDGPPEETWAEVVRALRARRASRRRRTRETEVEARVDLDAEGPVAVASGLGFFDHMLEQLAHHGGFALELRCRGDLRVDEHHTVEDCALVLGETLRLALGSKTGIARYGFVLPMDESLARAAVDLGGRRSVRFAGRFPRERVGDLPTELVPHFFRSLADGLGAALHVSVRGENTHHMVEACFKAVGRALRQAFRREGDALPSTKGVL